MSFFLSCGSGCQRGQVRVEASVGETDEPFVKPFLVGTALGPTHEKDRLPIRIEGDGDVNRR